MTLTKDSDVEISTLARKIRSEAKLQLPNVKMAVKKMNVSSKRVVLPWKLTEPIVLKAEAKSKSGVERYEAYCEGSFHAQPIPFAELAAEYRRERPKRADTPKTSLKNFR